MDVKLAFCYCQLSAHMKIKKARKPPLEGVVSCWVHCFVRMLEIKAFRVLWYCCYIENKRKVSSFLLHTIVSIMYLDLDGDKAFSVPGKASLNLFVTCWLLEVWFKVSNEVAFFFLLTPKWNVWSRSLILCRAGLQMTMWLHEEHLKSAQRDWDGSIEKKINHQVRVLRTHPTVLFTSLQSNWQRASHMPFCAWTRWTNCLKETRQLCLCPRLLKCVCSE